MHTQRPHRIRCSHNLPNWIILPDIPKLDLPISTSRDKLSEAPTLHMHISDPLLVLTPTFDHRQLGLFASIKDADSAVAIACAEDVAGYLVRG